MKYCRVIGSSRDGRAWVCPQLNDLNRRPSCTEKFRCASRQKLSNLRNKLQLNAVRLNWAQASVDVQFLASSWPKQNRNFCKLTRLWENYRCMLQVADERHSRGMRKKEALREKEKFVKWVTLCGSLKWQSRNTQGLVFQEVSEEVPSYSKFDPRHFISRSSTTVPIIINKQQWSNGSGRDSSLETMTSQRCWKMSEDGAAQSRCYVTSRNSEGNKWFFTAAICLSQILSSLRIAF